MIWLCKVSACIFCIYCQFWNDLIFLRLCFVGSWCITEVSMTVKLSIFMQYGRSCAKKKKEGLLLWSLQKVVSKATYFRHRAHFMMFFLKSGVKWREAIRNIVSSAYNETDLLLCIDTYDSSEDECETGKYMYIP